MFVCIVMYICLVFYIFSGLLGSGSFGCLFVLMYCKECGIFLNVFLYYSIFFLYLAY